MSQHINLTVPTNRFTIDKVPTVVTKRRFDGTDSPLPEIVFVDPETGVTSNEKSASINTFAFNGSALVTPSSVNNAFSLGIDDIDSEWLEGDLLVLDLKKGVEYGKREIFDLLIEKNVIDRDGNKASEKKYIILFRTNLMDEILAMVDSQGVADSQGLDSCQLNRPGITVQGARFLAHLNISLSYLIDGISFETQQGSKDGFLSTQILMNTDEERATFVPMIYHVSNTSNRDFQAKADAGNARTRIELGNVPGGNLPVYPVAVKVW